MDEKVSEKWYSSNEVQSIARRAFKLGLKEGTKNGLVFASWIDGQPRKDMVKSMLRLYKNSLRALKES